MPYQESVPVSNPWKQNKKIKQIFFISLYFTHCFSHSNFPVPSDEKHPHIMLLPFPCFTVGMEFSAWWQVGFLRSFEIISPPAKSYLTNSLACDGRYGWGFKASSTNPETYFLPNHHWRRHQLAGDYTETTFFFKEEGFCVMKNHRNQSMSSSESMLAF